MDDLDREIVRTWSALETRKLAPTPDMIAEWLRLALSDVERRMAAMRMTGQLP